MNNVPTQYDRPNDSGWKRCLVSVPHMDVVWGGEPTVKLPNRLYGIMLPPGSEINLCMLPRDTPERDQVGRDRLDEWENSPPEAGGLRGRTF